MKQPASGPGASVVIDAVRVEAAAGARDGFTYTVVIDPKPARQARPVRRPQAAAPAQAVKSNSGDRRLAPRQRTRLRSGKIFGAQQQFLADCLVHDLSVTGMRLRLRLPLGENIPSVFQVFDDLSGRLIRAEVLWRRGEEMGVRFVKAAEAQRNGPAAADMRRTFNGAMR